MRKPLAVTLVALALCAMLFAVTFSMPKAQPAATYPAHDSHPQEKLTAAADPYDTRDKASIFSIKWAEHGVVPVFVVITNDADQPASLVDGTFQLVLPGRRKFNAMSDGDLYRAVTKIKNPAGPHIGEGLPIPKPRRAKGGISEKMQDEIDQSLFRVRAVEPHATRAGFVYFQLGDDMVDLRQGHLYINGFRDATGHETMFFDIPFSKPTNGAAMD